MTYKKLKDRLNEKAFLDRDGYGLVIKTDDLHKILQEELSIDIYKQ